MYDVIILGAGPGGYIAAERAGAEGKSVLLIEKEELGGVCLNRGCIPTKTLLNSAKKYKQAKTSEDYGVVAEKVSFKLDRAMAWKNKVITTLQKGIAYQMKRHGVEVLKGSARFINRNALRVNEKTVEGKNIIIATGSVPVIPPIPGANQPTFVTSKEILQINKNPKSLIVIGGGVIGLEFASLFSSIGTEVHVVEMMDEVIPLMDGEMAKMLRKAMAPVQFHLKARVESIDGNTIHYIQNGEKKSLTGEKILMSVGRKPNIADMGFEEIGLDFDGKGIRTNEYMETNLPGIYAIGDVTGKSLLAHSASRMGEVAVNHICGHKDHMRYDAIPWVVYTSPEAAGIGLTEKEAKEKGIEVKTAQMQMRANGRFLAENRNAPGLCKVIVDKDTDALIGVHLLGNATSEMIFGAATMIEAELRVKDIKEIVFPHPTVSEIIKDTLWEI
jgi:dihydrolipoamide dehydrogenase